MAKPLTSLSATAILEEALHLLRRTPLPTLVCHLVGTAPFALALLLFWNDVTNPHTPDVTCARDSVVLALLLVWMNCWRAVFAGRLRRQLSGAPDSPWNWRRVWNLFAGQSFLGATKLVVLPAALFTILPFAWTVAFYRTAGVLADRPGMDLPQLLTRARQLAGLDRRQSWAILPLLFFLQIVLTLNLGLTLAMLPQLVRMLTGVESQFSQAGVYFIFTPLFLWATLAISWMVFDPFVQAVYCVRCFHGESASTGDDVRAGLRSLTAAGAAALLLLLLAPVHAHAAVSPDQLEKAVQQTLQSPEYDWRFPPPAAAAAKDEPWLVRVTERMFDTIKSFFDTLGRWVRQFFDWLQEHLRIAPMPQTGALPVTGLHWGLYALIGIVVVMAVWTAWRRNWFRPKRKKPVAARVVTAVRLDAEDLTADRLPEEDWLDLAAQSLAEGNYRLALRALYLANLAWLGRREFLTIHPGKTNREYELELRRKARPFDQARGLFALNIAAFERSWYGLHEVDATATGEFRRRSEQMKSLLPAPQGVAA